MKSQLVESDLHAGIGRSAVAASSFVLVARIWTISGSRLRPSSDSTQLPTEQELWRILDPHGREFKSLSAFERDFQRRREAFDRMLDEAESDVKGMKI